MFIDTGIHQKPGPGIFSPVEAPDRSRLAEFLDVSRAAVEGQIDAFKGANVFRESGIVAVAVGIAKVIITHAEDERRSPALVF